jgi:hypothetical protein
MSLAERLRRYFVRLFEDPTSLRTIQQFSRKVTDCSEIPIKLFGLKTLKTATIFRKHFHFQEILAVTAQYLATRFYYTSFQ